MTGKGRFSLVTGLAGRAWVQAAQRLDLPFLRTVVIGDKGSRDPYCAWARVREMDEAGALLVRPDGYVAWRMATAIWTHREAVEHLQDALDAILGRPLGGDRGPEPPGSPNEARATSAAA